MKEKRYSKNMLRATLEDNMRERRGEPELKVTPMEFSRWLKIYCEIHGLDENLLKAKTLPESVVDAFGNWLGDPLRVRQQDRKDQTTPLIGKGD